MRKDYALRFAECARNKGFLVEELRDEIIRQYKAGDSARLIASYMGGAFTGRSIQRWLKIQGIVRTAQEALSLAHKQGRVKYAYRAIKFKKLRKGLSFKNRYAVLERDGFKCVLCGDKGGDAMLEVDHVIAVCKGGSDELSNLRTLCYPCNTGKRLNDGEHAHVRPEHLR